MPVIPIYLNIDEKTYAGVQAGVLELCGLAKNADTKRVAKHIPTVADAAKDGASKAIEANNPQKFINLNISRRKLLTI